MQQVRMQHLSPEYIASNLMRSDWVVPGCYTASALGIACLLASETSCKAVKDSAGSRGAPDELTAYPAWTAAKRPNSAVQQDITWNLPLSDLRTLLDEHLHTQEENSKVFTRERGACAYSEVKLLQGRLVFLKLEIKSVPTPGRSTTGDNSVRSVVIGLYLCVQSLPPGSFYVVSGLLQFSVDASGAVGRESDITQGINNERSVAELYWGFQDLVDLGCIHNAAAGEASLKRQKLVHSDGCLHMAAKSIKLL